MSPKWSLKNMIFHRAQEKPEYHHTANCCQMLTHTFMHDMLIQIDDPGTVYSQIKAGTKLICQCSQQVILRSQHSAHVCQQDTQQIIMQDTVFFFGKSFQSLSERIIYYHYTPAAESWAIRTYRWFHRETFRKNWYVKNFRPKNQKNCSFHFGLFFA